MPWTAEARVLLAANKVPGRLRAYIDIEYNGGFGINVVEITSRVIGWGELERSTSAVDQNYVTANFVLRVDNGDLYFTPNLMAGGRARVSNVWSIRPSGEAAPTACRLYIDFEIRLADGSWESARMLRGRITDFNIPDSGGPAFEMIVADQLISKLDIILTRADGKTAKRDGIYHDP